MTGKADIRKWDKRRNKEVSRSVRDSKPKELLSSNTMVQTHSFQSTDLDMNTFDIINLDRIIFATLEGAGDTIAITETGIESIATGAASYGMKLQIPVNQVFQFKMGSVEKININTASIILNGVTKINDNYLEMDAITAPAVTSASVRRLYVDSADNHLKIRTDASTPIDLEVGGSSGAGLGDNNVWTGTNEFQNTVTVRDASFGIRDQSDSTKVANFECSGISSGTTRTYTLPDSTTSLAGLGVTTQTFTGKNLYINGTTWDSTYITDTLKAANCQVKFQGDGQAHSSYSDAAAQRVMEIGKYGTHEVKINAEITGSTGRTMTNPDGGSDIPVPGTNEPALAIKAAMIMNTYTMYDLDTLVFSQGASSTTPAPADDWVYIEANTGTTGTPVLTGMTYNVPTSMTHQFKVNGTLKVSIDDDIEFEAGSTLEIQNTIALPTSLSTGVATALPSAPTAYFKVHYAGADRYIPYYT